MHACMAVLAALVQRERTGEGAHLDVAVADGVLAFMSLYVDEYLATGEVPGPGHYKIPDQFSQTGGGTFNSEGSKTELETLMDRARDLPGPGEYHVTSQFDVMGAPEWVAAATLKNGGHISH